MAAQSDPNGPVGGRVRENLDVKKKVLFSFFFFFLSRTIYKSRTTNKRSITDISRRDAVRRPTSVYRGQYQFSTKRTTAIAKIDYGPKTWNGFAVISRYRCPADVPQPCSFRGHRLKGYVKMPNYRGRLRQIFLRSDTGPGVHALRPGAEACNTMNRKNVWSLNVFTFANIA